MRSRGLLPTSLARWRLYDQWTGSGRGVPHPSWISGGLLLTLLILLGALALSAGARAAGAGYWHTSGNQILDANNQPVRIAAINWYGFETTTFVAHGLWIADYKAILDRIKSTGFNTVRIPYSDQMMTQNPVLGTLNINRNGINTDIAANATALDVLDKIIAYCGQIGLRVMLDNHRSNAGNSAQENGLWYTNEFPESTWLANWRALTTRYLGNTTVVAMDLRNEPHASACWGGDPAGCSAANDWHAAATRAGNAILAINPNLLIVVEGHDRYNNSFTWWGGMLRGVATRPVVLSVPNRLVYSAHDYGPVEANQPWFNGSATPASLNAIKDQNWGFIYNNNTAPMFVGEFGTLNGNADIQSTTPGSQGQWFSATVSYFQGKPWMGHAYWAMNGNDRYALFNESFNGIVNPSKLTLLQTIQFPLDQQPGNVPAITSVTPTTVLPAARSRSTAATSARRRARAPCASAITVGTVTSWSASQIAVTAPTILPPGAYAVVVSERRSEQCRHDQRAGGRQFPARHHHAEPGQRRRWHSRSTSLAQPSAPRRARAPCASALRLRPCCCGPTRTCSSRCRTSRPAPIRSP